MGITSEHLVQADEQLLTVLTTLFTKILSDGAVPATMKSGLVHPVPKKGKNAKRPDSYRHITVTSIVGKVLERILMDPPQGNFGSNTVLTATGLHRLVIFQHGCSTCHRGTRRDKGQGPAHDESRQNLCPGVSDVH